VLKWNRDSCNATMAKRAMHRSTFIALRLCCRRGTHLRLAHGPMLSHRCDQVFSHCPLSIFRGWLIHSSSISRDRVIARVSYSKWDTVNENYCRYAQSRKTWYFVLMMMADEFRFLIYRILTRKLYDRGCNELLSKFVNATVHVM
jgi:hypothetical protein